MSESRMDGLANRLTGVERALIGRCDDLEQQVASLLALSKSHAVMIDTLRAEMRSVVSRTRLHAPAEASESETAKQLASALAKANQAANAAIVLLTSALAERPAFKCECRDDAALASMAEAGRKGGAAGAAAGNTQAGPAYIREAFAEAVLAGGGESDQGNEPRHESKELDMSQSSMHELADVLTAVDRGLSKRCDELEDQVKALEKKVESLAEATRLHAKVMLALTEGFAAVRDALSEIVGGEQCESSPQKPEPPPNRDARDGGERENLT